MAAFGEERKDHLFVAMLLSSSPETYSTLITTLESRLEDELTLGLTKSKWMDDYKRRKSVPDSEDSSAALRTSLMKNAKVQAEKSCLFCKKSRNYKQDCYKYQKWKSNRRTKTKRMM